jgi:hypothetical protein
MATKAAKIGNAVAPKSRLLIERCRYSQGAGVTANIYVYIDPEESAPGGKPRLVKNCCKALLQPYTGFKTRFDNWIPLSLCPQSMVPLTKFETSIFKIH